MSSSTPAARWRAVAAVAGAVALVAVVILAGWALTRPGPAVGTTVAEARRSVTATPTASASSPSAPRPALPRAAARDASLGSLTATSGSAPARLSIPDLDVDATVDAVGVQDDGAMVIPAAPTSVGWYRYGAEPTDPTGTTVIAGHVATREDGPGALAPLRSAEPGMSVTVTTADGAEHDYEVAGRERVVKKALPVDEIFARDGSPLLVLITCGGEYLPELRSHRDNVVVTAVPVVAGG